MRSALARQKLIDAIATEGKLERYEAIDAVKTRPSPSTHRDR